VIPRVTLGAPGIYRTADEPLRALTGVRMDVCAFLGVAPRGPARRPFFTEDWAPRPCTPGQTVQLAVPVAVESWDAYVRLYGSYAGPGLLPYAVSAFFQNGGRRAYIVRIVHPYLKPDRTPDDVANGGGIARASLAGLTASGGRAVWLAARNEGEWGNGLRVTLSLSARLLGLGPADFSTQRIRLPAGFQIAAGAVLRLALGSGVRTLRRVETLREERNAMDGTLELWASLDAPTAVAAQAAELVEGSLAIDDGVNPTEVLDGLGLSSNHPRWLASVLVNESSLLYPCSDPTLLPSDPLATWLDSDLDLDASLTPSSAVAFTGGADRYADIVPADFFDDAWVLGDECPGSGVHSLVDLPDVSLVVAPDLYSPAPLAPIESIVDAGVFAGAEFAECVEPPPAASQAAPADDLFGLRLDPVADLATIIALQRRLTDLADELASFIVLLDVPPGLSQRRILSWRGQFTSAWCAGYHPWVSMAPPDDPRDRPIAVSPSAVAAGIIAQRETELGVAYGPANVIATGAVSVPDRVSPARHAELHQSAINVYLTERDGIRLTAARTLALDQTWRQLNVRRLVTMICRVLDRQMQWAVFEPNDRDLRAKIVSLLEAYLRQLYRANAFTGATEAQAFFVRCDDALNPPAVTDQGRLLAQVGIAPAEPLEFIVLSIARSADSTLTVEA
jgi:hypothetical protein